MQRFRGMPMRRLQTSRPPGWYTGDAGARLEQDFVRDGKFIGVEAGSIPRAKRWCSCRRSCKISRTSKNFASLTLRKLWIGLAW